MADLIDRQAAIKAIENLQDCYNGFSDTYDKACIIGALEEVPSAQPTQKNESNTLDALDCVSRQAAIDVLEERLKANGYSNVALVSELNRSIRYLMQLPSAQPEYCLDEWCTKCKEYDHERHCCPRFNHVIRTTLQEVKEEQVERKKGKWVREDGIAHGIVSRVVKCSLCGKNAGLSEEGFWHLSDFCPNCGCAMKGEEE